MGIFVTLLKILFLLTKKIILKIIFTKNTKNPNLIYVTSHFDVIKKLVNKNHKVLVVNNYTKGNNNNIIPSSYDYESKDFLDLIYKNNNVSRISLLDEIFNFPLEKPYSNWTQTGSNIPYLTLFHFFLKK